MRKLIFTSVLLFASPLFAADAKPAAVPPTTPAGYRVSGARWNGARWNRGRYVAPAIRFQGVGNGANGNQGTSISIGGWNVFVPGLDLRNLPQGAVSSDDSGSSFYDNWSTNGDTSAIDQSNALQDMLNQQQMNNNQQDWLNTQNELNTQNMVNQQNAAADAIISQPNP